MKAVVLEQPSKLVFKDVEKPKPGLGEALLNVKAVSICGSDILRAFHRAAKMYPLILGHECAGVIAEVGEGVDDSVVGKRVAVAPLIPCMRCAACHRHIYSACKEYSFVGSRRHGGFAEYLTAPIQNLISLPDDVDFEVGAILEPSTVALHALEQGRIKAGQRVVIFGAGSIGLCTVQWARIKGAELIIATDVVDENLEAAKSLGAHVVFDPKDGDVVQQIMGLTGDGVDLALEMAGLPQTLAQAIMAVRARGVVVCMGNQPADATLPTTLIEHTIRQELEIRGTWMSYSPPFPGHEWTESTGALLQGNLDLQRMISHRFPLSATPEVFAQINSHALTHRKIILTP